MRRIRKKAGVVSVLIATLFWLVYEVGPGRAVIALANLSDPAKLSTLEKRGANPRLNKSVYWLDRARNSWLPADTAIGIAQTLNGTREPRATLVKDSLLRNLKIAEELGLLTRKNRNELRRGQAPTITRGPYRGQKTDVDHIVPFSLAPEIGNELANLELLPHAVNLRKSNKVGDRQLAHADKLAKAGLLTGASLARVKAAM